MKIKIASVFLVFVFLLAACAPAAATPTAQFPTGRFVQDNKPNSGYIFNAYGTWTRFEDMFTVASGTYKVEGNVYTELTNDDCPANVSFNYTFDGKKLTFNYVGNPQEDTCLHRSWDMNNITYTLAEENSNPESSALPEITVDAADYSYTAPETVTTGWVRIILTNSGSEPHHVQFLRLNDGVTVDQFEETLKQGEGPALAMTKQVGGVGAIHPGGTAQSVINLPAGEYVILCLIPSPSDGMAHHTKGMIKSLKVEEGDNAAAEPAAGLTVHLKDFMFEMPESLPAGPLTVEVINDGPEAHEFNILRLEDGKTVSDVMKFLNGAGGPPPFAPVGGMNGLDTGLKGYAELNLEDGTYVAICNIPSPMAKGTPHFDMGMIKPFTVGTGAGSATSNFPTGKFLDPDEIDSGFIFNADGTFSTYLLGNQDIHGTYRIEGDTFIETSNDGGCPSNLSLTYTFDGSNLTFNYVGDPNNDPCPSRRGDFNNQTYVLTP